VAAAAVVVYVLLAGAPGMQPGAPSVATAADLLARMDAAWTNASTIQGRLVERITWTDKHGKRSSTVRTHVFAATSQGDFRLEVISGGDDQATGESPSPRSGRRGWTDVWIYDSKTNTQLHGSGMASTSGDAETGASGTASLKWYRVLDYWSGTGPSPLLEFFNGLSTYATRLRSALADGDSGLPVTATTYDGRPAWRVVVYDVDRADRRRRYEILADSASGFPVSWSHTDGDGTWTITDECDVTDFRVNEPIAARTLSVTAPLGFGRPRTFETEPRYGYLQPGYVGFCSLDEVEGRVGYRPPVPADVPAGFELAAVATDPLVYLRRRGRGETPDRLPELWFNSSGNRPLASWHEPDSEVGLTYRRGFDSFWIQAAPAGANGLPMEAVVQALRHAAFSRRTLKTRPVESGRFAGGRAVSWYDARGVGVVVWDDELAVYIGGALTRAQALAVARSLQTYRD
jgi:hypothetical protein